MFHSKFTNLHLLYVMATIAFLTYYVPVAIFTTYASYIPEWTLPLFWVAVRIPGWFNEFAWKTASFGSDSYIMFHQLHYELKEWKKHPADIFYTLTKFTKWYLRKAMFWVITALMLGTLWYGYTGDYVDFIGYQDELHPFTPFYIGMSLWWITFIRYYKEFKRPPDYMM